MFLRPALLVLATLLPAALNAQGKGVDITGTWKVDAGTDVGNAPREVVIRSDSSASWGKEIARWRMVKDKIWIALGGEWEKYDLKVKGDALTMSGGGLKKAVTLKKSGPATALPPGAKVPPDPDAGGE